MYDTMLKRRTYVWRSSFEAMRKLRRRDRITWVWQTAWRRRRHQQTATSSVRRTTGTCSIRRLQHQQTLSLSASRSTSATSLGANNAYTTSGWRSPRAARSAPCASVNYRTPDGRAMASLVRLTALVVRWRRWLLSRWTVTMIDASIVRRAIASCRLALVIAPTFRRRSVV